MTILTHIKGECQPFSPNTLQSQQVIGFYFSYFSFPELSLYNDSRQRFLPDAFALAIGLGNSATKENLLKQYREVKIFNTGIFGTDILTGYLSEQGEVQLLFDLLSSQEYPSFGYMQKCGATTLLETWDGKIYPEAKTTGELIVELQQ